jgi:bifunctional DNA-binding transcriptional regulator/antitoxin component of YhaV-PrlF toxin-antitoxin module
MKLQKRLSRKIGKKEYVKWILTIPPKMIEILGWKEGQEVEVTIKEKDLLIRTKDKA